MVCNNVPYCYEYCFSATFVESKRSSPSLLARQIRLRLVAAEDSDMPKTLSNIIVSIHAIATFQALHDYLRPRVAGLMAGGSRLSNMLAALAQSGFTGSSSGGFADDLSRSSATENASSSNPATRRRSQRLSAKIAGQQKDSNGSPETQLTEGVEASQSATGRSPIESPGPGENLPSDTVVNEDDFAEFTDDEVDVDAEVIDDDGDQDVPEKTVTVSVGDGK
jgi:E3 ubiquitin-protein ligase TRIP12